MTRPVTPHPARARRERLRRLVATVRRRVRLRTRLRRLPQRWRRAFPRRLPAWSEEPPAISGAPLTGSDPGVLAVDARTANPRSRQHYGPRLPAGELRIADDGRWEVTRAPDGTTVVAGRAGTPLDERQRAVLAELGLITVSDLRPGHADIRFQRWTVVQLAMTGVVLYAPAWTQASGHGTGGASTPADGLADELAAILTAPLPGGDPLQWEVRSIRQRRAAMRHHTAGLVAPPVSAVLVSKRPHLAERQVATLAGQTYPDLQIVVGLHAGTPPPGLREAAGGRPLEVVLVPAERNLGEALQDATGAAAGTLLTKVDDDDRYGPEHVWDLVLAHHFSGATTVGKGSEFVFVEPKNVTVRRHMGAEFFTDTVAGGTIALHRDDLATAGGWPPAPRHVDRALLDAVVEGGGTVYRTHPFGFVYTRHGDGHTWQADLDQFLRDARQRWRGAIGYDEFGAG